MFILIDFDISLFPAPPENSAPPPDVTAVSTHTTSRGPRVDLPSNAAVRGMSRGQSRSSMMETADGKEKIIPLFLFLSRVSSKFFH